MDDVKEPPISAGFIETIKEKFFDLDPVKNTLNAKDEALLNRFNSYYKKRLLGFGLVVGGLGVLNYLTLKGESDLNKEHPEYGKVRNLSYVSQGGALLMGKSLATSDRVAEISYGVGALFLAKNNAEKSELISSVVTESVLGAYLAKRGAKYLFNDFHHSEEFAENILSVAVGRPLSYVSGRAAYNFARHFETFHSNPHNFTAAEQFEDDIDSDEPFDSSYNPNKSVTAKQSSGYKSKDRYTVSSNIGDYNPSRTEVDKSLHRKVKYGHTF